MLRFAMVLVLMSFIPRALAKDVPVLLDIESDVDEKETLITLKFDKRFSSDVPKVQDHGTFLNVPLAGAMVAEPGKFYDGKGPYFTKIATFQLGQDNSAVRIFLRHDASKVNQGVAIDLLNDRLIISIDHAKLAALGLNQLRDSQESVHQTLAKTQVDKSIEDPASHLSATIEAEQKEDPFQRQLTMVSIFSGVMLAALGLFYLFYGRFRNLKNAAGEASITLKKLASYSLAPKRDIALVQVGDQKILLGVTAENINFLTAIESPNPVPSERQRSIPQQSQFQAMVMAGAQARNDEMLRTQQVVAKNATRTAPTKSQITKGSQVAKASRTNRDQKKESPQPKVAIKKSVEESEARKVALNDVTSMIRQKLKDLPQI